MGIIFEKANRYLDWLSDLRRGFHRCPELALKEFKTALSIENVLDSLGISHTRIGDTGVLGILKGVRPGGSVVALRADIDALPLQEENDVEYRSLNDGAMHACGHDLHTSCLLGAARLLSEMKADISGEIRFIFQPAEETGGGAMDFINSGDMNGTDRVFGLHVAPDLKIGTVCIKPGLNNAAVDHFRIRIHGKSAHVSTPHLGSDALYAACQAVVAIQGLVTRRSSPVEPIILGIGMLNSGTTYNAVAEYAEMEGTTRTVSQETRMRVRGMIDETCANIAAVSGAEAEVIWTGVCSALINDPLACEEAGTAAAMLDTSLNVINERPLSLGGDNFAEFILQVPGCYAYLGTSNPELPHTQVGIHNCHFDLDEKALAIGAGIYAATALRWLGFENLI